MTGYESKRAAARDKLDDDDTQIYQTELTKLLMESYDRGVADALEETKAALTQPAQEHVAVQHHDDTLTIAYQSGYYDGKKAAQPAQEPFGYFRYDARLDAWVQNCGNNQGTPFYTTPPQRLWVGLTEEDLKPLCAKWRIVYGGWTEDFARDIETKLKEKNNAA